MIESTTSKKVVFLDLVEHPGGHDGGEFPHRDEFGVADDGTLWYQANVPESPTDTFCGYDPTDYALAETREEALGVLEGQLAEAKQHVANLEALVAAFREDRAFVVYDGKGEYTDEEDEYANPER